MKIVINKCYGCFGLSDAAYEWLIKNGIPARKYIKEVRGKNGLYKKCDENEGEIIFDRKLSIGDSDLDTEEYIKFMGRYWETWIRDDNRNHPLVVKCVEKLGKKSWGRHAELRVVEIPDDVQWEISDYDGIENIHEKHRVW